MGCLIIEFIWFLWTASCTHKFYMIRDPCSVGSYNSSKFFDAIDDLKRKQSSQFCQLLHPCTSELAAVCCCRALHQTSVQICKCIAEQQIFSVICRNGKKNTISPRWKVCYRSSTCSFLSYFCSFYKCDLRYFGPLYKHNLGYFGQRPCRAIYSDLLPFPAISMFEAIFLQESRSLFPFVSQRPRLQISGRQSGFRAASLKGESGHRKSPALPYSCSQPFWDWNV